MSMFSTRRCVACVVLAFVLALGIGIGILFPGIWPFAAAAPTAPGTTAAPSGPADGAPAKRTAEAVASEWTFNPGKKKLQAWGAESAKSGENLVAVSCRIQDNGKAREWFVLAAKFYAAKCGSDQDCTSKHVFGFNGESKSKGRYLITEPAAFSTPLIELQSNPNQFILFAHHDADSTVTVVVKQQGGDVVLIALTAAVR
jgi:hypothetical protein